MSTMYCALCARPVEATRQMGVGTVVLAVLTVGISLLAYPFYPKRCSICRSSAVSALPPGAGVGGASSPGMAALEKRLSLLEDELESAGSELRRLQAERDFYRQLLDNPAARQAERPGETS